MSQSKRRQSGEVRIGHSLNHGEQNHVSRRRGTVIQCLWRHSIKCDQDTIPNIALLGSGGGERAMLGLLGSLVQLQKCDLLDSILYLGGVSGSTWCMASLYKEPDWSTQLDAVQEKIIKRLDGPAVSWSDAWTKLEKYYNQKDNFSLTDVWAAMFVTTIKKEIDETTVSNQREYHSKDPYPIYTVIDKQCKKDKLNRDVWFGIVPHEAGYSLTGAFVDSTSFGSQFKNGSLIKKQPEMDMLYLQGLCGSALADREEISKWIWEQIPRIYKYSSQGREVLSTLVKLNICVLNKEDPTSLINDMTVLLKGKLDKHGRAMFISAKEVLYEPKHDRLKQYTLNICENFEDWFGDSATGARASWIIPKIIQLLCNWTWGTTYNFVHNMKVQDVNPSVLSEKERYYEDAGLLINSPYFPVLRKERHIDLIISFDFSAGDPMETVKKTSQMCKELKIPFPEVHVPEPVQEPTDFYLFEGKNEAPTVIHIPLFNKVNCGGCIKEWEKRYSTFQGPYSHDMIIDLIKKAGENVINNKEKLVKTIQASVEKKKAKLQ
ncbi:cytosolic phospholipase A2 gamma-like [Chanos chanos]|uniref:Cytosolic phospholipase A2 gamma-like n=1 Tax=Chanos chanos TaxID=29144 RepID=A0A6J2WX91_CHACN|nr:cytosolic phospholipase A2 gamma-like [Chanos chanos]